MSLRDKIKQKAEEWKAKRAANQECWPCSMQKCYLVAFVTPYDAKICKCCRNQHEKGNLK